MSQVTYRAFTSTGLGQLDPDESSLAELVPQQVAFTSRLNAPGQCSISAMKLPGATARRLDRASIEPGNASLWLQRGGEVVWGGVIWDASSDSENRYVEIVAEEFPSALGRFTLDREAPDGSTEEVVFGGAIGPQKTAWIVGHLLYRVRHFVGGVRLGLRQYPAPTPEVPWRGYTYWPNWAEYDDRYILDLITELAAIGQHEHFEGALPVEETNGFDWAQEILAPGPRDAGVLGPNFNDYPTTWDPLRTPDGAAVASSTYQACLATHHPRKGRDLDWPRVEKGYGTAETAQKVTWSLSARAQSNRLKVKGLAGPGGGGSQQRATVSSGIGTREAPSGYLRLDKVLNYPHLKTFEQVSSVAKDVLPKVAYPVLNVKAALAVDERHYSFGSVQVGDRVPTHIVDGDIDHGTQMLRAVAVTYSLTRGAGYELVELDLQPDLPAGAA